LGGNDVLQGLDGDDVIEGGDLNDEIDGGRGSDTLRGGAGNDDISDGVGVDFVDGGEGNDDLTGELVFGRTGNDNIDGGGGSTDDLLFGNQGRDVISGGGIFNTGDDILYGGMDDDTLIGGADDDFLSGDLGDDVLNGGDEDDIFAIRRDAGMDIIEDFGDGRDQIGLQFGLQLSELNIVQGSGDNEGNTLITLAADGQVLAVLQETDASSLSASEFVTYEGFGGIA
jgi:Ca2+-binding RTX toxin-like protein